MNEVKERMKELFKPIDKQIMMCDDGNEVMMLACVMLQSAKDILDSQLGQLVVKRYSRHIMIEVGSKVNDFKDLAT